MPDIPDAFCSHKTSERIRLKIPSKKGDTAYFVLLQEQLFGCSGIEKVEVNPVTGSVLFIHRGDSNAVAEYAEKKGIFRLNGVNSNTTNLHKSVSGAFKGINNQIKGATGGDMDMGALAFLALLGAGIYQISKGNFTVPAWYTAFWYALNIFLKAKPDKGVK